MTVCAVSIVWRIVSSFVSLFAFVAAVGIIVAFVAHRVVVFVAIVADSLFALLACSA